MGIKMKKVICDGQEITISQYNANKIYKDLRCFYCGAKVIFVNSHERDLGEKRIIVQRHFRLKSGYEHAPNCRYTVDGQLKDIYATCADNELITKRDNVYVVRLKLIADDISKSVNVGLKDESGRGKRELNYVSVGKKTAYLSTMKKIIELRAQVENEAELSEKVQLQFFDYKNELHFVRWRDFFYDIEKETEYARLLKYLMESRVYHPICVVGIVKDIKELKDKRYYMDLEPVNEGKDKKIAVALYFNESVYREVSCRNKGDKVVVYAKYKFDKKVNWPPNSEHPRIVYYNIKGMIYNAKQVYNIKD